MKMLVRTFDYPELEELVQLKGEKHLKNNINIDVKEDEMLECNRQ